ncbi:hypothetical protein ACJJTC_011165 [Scirpophaga incertulas]
MNTNTRTEHIDESGEPLNNTEITTENVQQTENMDNDTKKSQSYSANSQVKYGYIKYVSLVILTLQNAALGLSMRYARTRNVVMFSSAAVVLNGKKGFGKIDRRAISNPRVWSSVGSVLYIWLCWNLLEKVLKESDISVSWMRNVQLSLLSLPFGLVTYLINNGGSMKTMLTGFDGFVWYLVILQAAGGLIVAVVLLLYIFEFILTIQFAVGTMLVIGSIFLYGYVPKKKETRSSLSV